MTLNRTWFVGDRVQVSLPYGQDGRTVHLATIARLQDPGPHQPHRTIKVIFDDPLVFGGMGVAWVSPDVIALEGTEPAPPEWSYAD